VRAAVGWESGGGSGGGGGGDVSFFLGVVDTSCFFLFFVRFSRWFVLVLLLVLVLVLVLVLLLVLLLVLFVVGQRLGGVGGWFGRGG
jgi:hypothetical protein